MSKTRELVLGAMCVAMVAILVLISAITAGYFPILIPLPLMLYGARAQFRNLVLVSISAFILVFMLSGLGYAALAGGYIIVALSYTWLVKKEKKSWVVFWVTTLINGVNFLVMLLFFASVLEVNIDSEMLLIGGLFGIHSRQVLLVFITILYSALVIVETWLYIRLYKVLDGFLI